jgi:diadenosine tetraphosphate (Ap4A) HIT family hydrolase
MAASYCMSPHVWRERVSGAACPFCEPREDDGAYWIKVVQMSASTLYLSRDQRWRGRCLLIADGPHRVGLSAFPADQARALLEDLRVASGALEQAVQADLVNLASLGNQIPHMHWHLIPRVEGDARWGAPPWTTAPDEVPAKTLAEPELRQLAEQIQALVLNAQTA